MEEAERQLGRLAAVDPDSLPVAELRARILTARGKAAEAVAGLESVFADRINTPEGLAIGARMIRLLLELNQPQAAERVARQLSGLGPRGTCLLAEFLAAHGQTDEAIALLRAVAGAGGNRDAGSSSLTIAQAPARRPTRANVGSTSPTPASPLPSRSSPTPWTSCRSRRSSATSSTAMRMSFGFTKPCSRCGRRIICFSTTWPGPYPRT